MLRLLEEGEHVVHVLAVLLGAQVAVRELAAPEEERDAPHDLVAAVDLRALDLATFFKVVFLLFSEKTLATIVLTKVESAFENGK